MRQWYENGPEIGAYNQKLDISPSNLRLSNNLSPFTNFFLNVFMNSFENKNIIIAYPDVILKPIPLVSYLYCHEMKKDVLVFTQTNHQKTEADPIIAHNRNYHLLNYSISKGIHHMPALFEGEYIFYHTPIGIISDNEVTADVYLPRIVKKELRKKYIEQQTKNFFDNRKPRILLNCEGRVHDLIEKFTIEDIIYNSLKVSMDPKLIVFENLDRFIHSDYTAELFNKWISNMPSDKHLILHFSNPESRYIPVIKNQTNSLVIPMLKDNLELKNASILYFNEKRYAEEWKILNRYNIDSLSLYKDETPINVVEPHLEAGNVDNYLETFKSLAKRINEKDLINRDVFFILRKLSNELPNLVINPSKHKIAYGDKLGIWRHYTVPELLYQFKDIIQEENSENSILLKEMIAEIFCLYLELKECKRCNERITFSRIGKDYAIVEVINKLFENRNGSKIIIGTQSSFERNTFKKEMEKLNIDNLLEIKSIDQISKSNFERKNSILVLGGPLHLRYLSQLLLPYKEIIYLCYEGSNYELVNEQINLFQSYSYQRNLNSLNYINEIYEHLRVHKSSIFKGFRHSGSEVNVIQKRAQITAPPKGNEHSVTDYLNNIMKILKSVPQYRLYKEYEEESNQIESTMLEINKKSIDDLNEKSEIYYRVCAKVIGDDEIIEKILPAEKTYLYLENEDGDILEGTPKVIKPYNFIVILDNDVRKSFLELIMDVFGLEESIDKRFIEIWGHTLFRFIEDNDLSYAEFYRIYQKAGGKRGYQTVLGWARGEVLGPLDPKDLYHIGKILDNKEIIENFYTMYQEIQELRELHRNTGRKLKTIIKEILKGRLNPDRLSFEEYMFYEKVRDGIFKVMEIQRSVN